jgi:hypothetical protein
MRRIPFRVPAILVILLVAPSLSGTAFASGQWGVSGFAGYHSYSMSDLNDEVIAPINLVLSGTGYSMDKITSGIGFGGGIRYRTPGKLTIGVDYERLDGSSELKVPGGSFKISTPADAVSATLVYFFPSTSKARFGLGGGLGYYSSSGEAKVYDSTTQQEQSESLEGSGVGVHGVGAMDLTLSPVAHLEANIGYRYAKTTDLTIAGTKAQTSSGDDAKLDWSGLLTRVGFTFYFGSK